jgi:hypothetical protein
MPFAPATILVTITFPFLEFHQQLGRVHTGNESARSNNVIYCYGIPNVDVREFALPHLKDETAPRQYVR